MSEGVDVLAEDVRKGLGNDGNEDWGGLDEVIGVLRVDIDGVLIEAWGGLENGGIELCRGVYGFGLLSLFHDVCVCKFG